MDFLRWIWMRPLQQLPMSEFLDAMERMLSEPFCAFDLEWKKYIFRFTRGDGNTIRVTYRLRDKDETRHVNEQA